MPIFSASLINPSLKEGCAIPIRSSALSHVVFPLRSAAPYSVTMKLVAILGVVTIAPGARAAEIKDSTSPLEVTLVDGCLLYTSIWLGQENCWPDLTA